jgi:hypothetical protein
VVAEPLLPLRVPASWTRGSAYFAVAVAMVGMLGMFGMFLFLTYYMQVVKDYTALKTGWRSCR